MDDTGLDSGSRICTNCRLRRNPAAISVGSRICRGPGKVSTVSQSGRRESVAKMTIHMFFVFFPIAVIWLDSEKRVVDKALALPFRPYYAPQGPAQYYVEGHPLLLERVSTGDRLEFD